MAHLLWQEEWSFNDRLWCRTAGLVVGCKLFWKRHYALIKRGLLSAAESGLSCGETAAGIPHLHSHSPPGPPLLLLQAYSLSWLLGNEDTAAPFIGECHCIFSPESAKRLSCFTRPRARRHRVPKASANLFSWELSGLSSIQDSPSQRRKEPWILCWKDVETRQETSRLTPSTSFKSPWG